MKRRLSFSILVLILLSLALSPGPAGLAFAAPAVQDGPPTPLPPDATEQEAAMLEDVESAYKPDYVKLATGNPLAVPAWKAAEIERTTGERLGTHATYAWPFTLTGGLGWNIQSYQDYGGTPYFHHGIDMLAVNGTDVYNRPGGQVINVENYTPGNDLYWEVAVLDPEGYIWQYHHIDKNTIPQYIKDKFAEYQADPVNGGFIPADTYIGDIVYWPVVTFGYRFNHIHLNILAAGGVYLNGMEFHTLLADTAAPQIQAIGLLKNNTTQPGNTISGNYGLYVRARDLVLSPVYYLPPYEVTFSVDGGETRTVWEFANLPGGASDTLYLSDYYVVPPTCGDYSCRDYYIDVGFTTSGQYAFPTANGSHTVNVTVYDYNGNTASGSFTWTVTDGATATFTPTSTRTATRTPTFTPTSTSTQTPTDTPTVTATPTSTPTAAPGPTMHMGVITLSYSVKKSTHTVTASTKVLDVNGKAVPSATVAARWTLPDGTTTGQQAPSNKTGAVSFKITSKLTGPYNFCVTDVTKTGWVYDPSKNVETCDSLTIP